MISASEARSLAGPTLDEKIESIGVRIEELAKEKKRVLRCGWDYTPDKELWIDGGYGNTKEWLKAKKKLEALGYHVEFYYSEGQFVDMYTKITW